MSRASVKPKLLFVVTEDWYFYSHRIGLAIAAKRAGFDVAIATRIGRHRDDLESTGFELFDLKFLKRRTSGPIHELRSIIELASIYRTWKPTIVHHVALKPVVYGNVAAYLYPGLVSINALAGLGYVFTTESAHARLLRLFIKPLLRLILNRSNSKTIVQNPENLDSLRKLGVNQRNIRLIRSAGVDLSVFQVGQREKFRSVLLPARLLWDKGVGDFVKVATIIRKNDPSVEFILAGDIDESNPRSVSKDHIRTWEKNGHISWAGHVSDMPHLLSKTMIVCLPTTYGEGVPKALVEAAASGLPLVAYDVPGCREIVKHGRNGFLLKPADIQGLVSAITYLLDDKDSRLMMGLKSRELAEDEFSDADVHARTLKVYQECLDR